jgi:Na+-transporting NADH:ubiquinone oxidoreductase subunit F
MLFLEIDVKLIIFAIPVFLVLMMVMAWGLVFAKKKLVPQGAVKLVVNGDTEKPIEVQPGSSLLSALAGENVFLPSACGGGGTCAMCKCQVLSGGGDILPTEQNHISRKDAADNWRLACQVKVRQDMEIKVPEEIFGIKKWECEVVSNDNVATFIKEFVVKLPEGENLTFDAGGYIQIDVPVIDVDFKNIDVQPEYREDWDKFRLWDLKMSNPEEQFRAYSMANHPAEGNIVMLNIRIATPPMKFGSNRNFEGYLSGINPGICSSYVFSRKPGDKVFISGPYGEFHIKKTSVEKLYIGGGAGMAPLRSQIFHMFHTEKRRDCKVSYWYGGRSKRELFYIDEFEAIERDFDNFKFHAALSDPLAEDNWTGYTGFIHNVVLENYLKNHPEPEAIEYYLCGPPMMNSAVFKMLDDLGVPKENIAFDDFGG